MTDRTTTTGPPPKATLICPECGHTSPPDGDWRLQRRPTTTIYRCPVCDAEVTRRPAHSQWTAVATVFATVPVVLSSVWQGYLGSLRRFFRH
ncbi:MAG: hypothetical protein ABEI57_06355 [Halapricum sp.]